MDIKNVNKITMTLESIGPKEAKEYLKDNVGNNRKIRKRAVDWLAFQMSKKKWMTTHQGIAFDTDRNLVDGQTRLTAIIASGETIMTLVFRGCDPETFKVMDTGKVRTPGDVLYTAGVGGYASLIASASRMIMAYKMHGGMTLKERLMISNSMILQFAQDNVEEMQQLCKRAVTLAKTHGSIIGTSQMVALTFITSRLRGCDPETAKDFFEKIYTGANLPNKSPLLLLRNWLIDERSADKKHSWMAKYVMIVKGWNYHRTDYPTQRMWTYRKDEKIPDLI